MPARDDFASLSSICIDLADLPYRLPVLSDPGSVHCSPYVTIRLRRIPIGRAWEALREDEVACRALGINTTTTKLTAFATGAMFGGFAGSFFADPSGLHQPGILRLPRIGALLAIVVLGGMGSQTRRIAIAALAMIGTELLREMDFLKAIFSDAGTLPHAALRSGDGRRHADQARAAS
jgi:ABC-type branched-subunit amino acid transport system permease subunit